MLLDVTLWGQKDDCASNSLNICDAHDRHLTSLALRKELIADIRLFFSLCVFSLNPCSPTGAVKARYTTHSSPPQCCRRRRHHRWPGLCLCPCQTPSLRPHQQKEVQPPPPHRVSMTEAKRRLLAMLCAPEFTLKPCPLLCELQQ